jgi:hypothetical protein
MKWSAIAYSLRNTSLYRLGYSVVKILHTSVGTNKIYLGRNHLQHLRDGAVLSLGVSSVNSNIPNLENHYSELSYCLERH